MEAFAKPREGKLEIADQKARLSALSKTLAKKATAREKLTPAEFAQIRQSLKLSNGIGLRMVERQQTVDALDLLKQAENVALLLLRISEQSQSDNIGQVLKLLANTYNNIGYLFSQAGNLENAYTYLIRTLEAETRAEYSNYRKGLTCLNISNLLMKMQKFKETSKFAGRAIEEFQTTLVQGEDVDSPDKLFKVKEKLVSAYEIAAIVAISQDKQTEAHKMYEEALNVAEEIFGSSDTRTMEYRAKIDELLRTLPLQNKEKTIQSERSTKITKESILATTYGTFSGSRLKLIIVDYIKGKSLKIYGMRKDGSFVKSLCLPYTVFQVYFQVEGKAIGPQDIRNENAIEWMMNHITLSVDGRLLFTHKLKE